jgi:pimeloyl-ACP methyl ester carboxylesterase
MPGRFSEGTLPYGLGQFMHEQDEPSCVHPVQPFATAGGFVWPARSDPVHRLRGSSYPPKDKMKFRKVLRVTALAAGTVLFASYLLLLVTYQVSKRSSLAELEQASSVAETVRGPVEYARSGAGPVVLVLHGTPGGYDRGVQLRRELTGRGLGVLTVSRPGYLRTPLDVGRTPAEQADAYAALLDALGIDRVGVMAVSGGSPSALEFARRHPDRVWALALVAPVTGSIGEEGAGGRSAFVRATDALFGRDFAGWAQVQALRLRPELVLSEGSGLLNEDSRRRFREDPAKLANLLDVAAASLMNASLRRRGVENDHAQFARLEPIVYRDIASPTLLVHGTGDTMVPIAHAEAAAREIPGAELLELQDGDHFISVSRPEDFFPRLLEFLTQHAPSPLDQPGL